ncbi:MAG TPA: O-antigen ligase family protein [Clostridia bacterium]|nr:O-antigen ligase family protein [Clostridia bacterium]
MNGPSLLLATLASLTAVTWFVVLILDRPIRARLTPQLIVGALIWTMGASLLLPALIPRSSLNVGVPGELPSALPPNFVGVSHFVNAVFLVSLALGLAYVSITHLPRRPGRSIWVTGLLLTCAFALSSVFGTVRSVDWKLVTWPLTITVVYLLPRVPLRWLVRQLQHLFMITVVGSLASWLLFPHWALSSAGAGPSSFLDRSLRLQGLTLQANGLGQIALLGFLATYWLKEGRFRRISLGGCMLALVLSGSRTAILALPLCLACLWAYKARANRSIRMTSVVVLFGISAVGAAYAALAGFTGTGNGFTANLGSLNGRTQIWSLTIDEWRRSPLVGYGPTIWSPAYRLSHGVGNLTFAGHAHNQFIETLGQGGLVGLAALTAFLLALFAWAWRSRSVDQGLALSFGLVVLITMLTESPLALAALPVSLYPVFAAVIVTMTSASLDLPGDRPANPVPPVLSSINRS